MRLITSALRHPVTIVVAILAIVFFSFLSIRNTKVDIFPRLGLPTVYVAQPYGGLSPDQVEGFVTSYYEYHFLYITGVKYVDSRSIQGAALIKIEFNEGTDMSQAMAEVVGYVNRARAFMPPGTVPPFITRFDAGSVPVGQLVFSSDTRSLSEISDLALFRVRPMFSTLPGVSAPPPFGGNQKTVLITIDPAKLRSYNLSADQVVQTLVKFNTITPAGNVRIGDSTYITPQNSVVESLQDLQNMPLQLGTSAAVYVRDIANVSLGADVTTSYALIDGKRSVYIPVTKRADASTWDVVQRVKAALPDMQAAIPSDIKVTYAFDQSGYVLDSLKSLLLEGGLGALLTGLVVLLFLRDSRSALIVILTIPLALLAAATALYLAGQTINIMTLGGLALSVGILVDEATVTVENIHRHQGSGKSIPRAVADACREMAAPKLLILLCILAVFIPSLFMNGIPKAMFLPLSLAVGFAMIASFLLSQTFVPVIACRWLRPAKEKVRKSSPPRELPAPYTILFLLFSAGLLTLMLFTIGTELFPPADTGQTQVRLRLPTGSRVERTEDATRKLLSLAAFIAGKENIEISSAFVGTQPSSYPVNYIHLWTSGPHESVTRIKLKRNVMPIESFREQLRAAVATEMPGVKLSFEPGDIATQVLNMGSNNPVEIAVVDRNLDEGQNIARRLTQKLSGISSLRDVQIATPLDYPAIRVEMDRVKAAALGITGDQLAKNTVPATTSSRFTTPSYWLDKSTGTAYQVQVQFPEYSMNSTAAMAMIPVSSGAGNTHYLDEVARLRHTTVPGEYDRLNQQRYITVTANIHRAAAGHVYKEVRAAMASIGPLPAGAKLLLRGQAELLQQTRDNLRLGLLIATVLIFLVLSVFFQSFRVALTILAILPAVISGSLVMLKITGLTLNIQSYMGMIMAAGVSVANAVLFVTSAEQARRQGIPAPHLHAAAARRRPILMTGIAMIAGMLPMSLGLSDAGGQTAPLGIAVIGGLLFSLASVIFFLPTLYRLIAGRHSYKNISLDPDDKNSAHYDQTS